MDSSSSSSSNQSSFVFKFVLVCLMYSLSISFVSAHMNMVKPIPRTHKFNPFTTERTVDYDIMAPLDGVKKPFACGGTQRGPSVQTVKPGDLMQVQIEGGAPHRGGHCEFSLSYDGATFVSLRTILRDCLVGTLQFDVPFPSSLPGGPAVFSWSWVNAEGNREFYQNCADITVDSPTGTAGALVGPAMVVANLPGFPTIPEMVTGVDDMRSLYINRPSISISPSGVIPSVMPTASATATNSVVNAPRGGAGVNTVMPSSPSVSENGSGSGRNRRRSRSESMDAREGRTRRRRNRDRGNGE